MRSFSIEGARRSNHGLGQNVLRTSISSHAFYIGNPTRLYRFCSKVIPISIPFNPANQEHVRVCCTLMPKLAKKGSNTKLVIKLAEHSGTGLVVVEGGVEKDANSIQEMIDTIQVQLLLLLLLMLLLFSHQLSAKYRVHGHTSGSNNSGVEDSTSREYSDH